MHINVLAVQQLRDLAARGTERAGALAAELRERVVSTVYDSWEETGFVWEQYDDGTGKGRKNRAFTGWTASVILLMGSEAGGAASENAGTSSSRAPVAVLVAFLALGVIFRRQVISSVDVLTRRWRGRRRRWRSGGRYDEVLDLDAVGMRPALRR